MNQGLLQIHQKCISGNLPFVTFRLPQHDHSTTYIQLGERTADPMAAADISREAGFIMAPFDTRNGHPYLTIRPDLVLEGPDIGAKEINKVEQLEDRPSPRWPEDDPIVTGKKKYMEQVDEIKTTIANGAFQKAVLSRIRLIEGQFFSIIPELFQEICRRHPNAFVYLFKREEHFWMGASPEPLIRLREGRISTVSLAGTRPYSKENMDIDRWNVKEVLEQEYVTRYIHDVIHSFGIRDYRVSSPYVKKAGNLVHLRTDFSMDFEKIRGRLWKLVEALHPTPAVAGQPKEDAITFIKKLEPHDRAYYTGFLGPLEGEKAMDLFVNLRCMRITPGQMGLYVGGGITLDSDPADEYAETTWKAESLLKFLRKHIKNMEHGPGAPTTYR